MKTKWIWVGILSICFISSVIFWACNLEGIVAEGSKPFTPTRIEWMCSLLNGSLHVEQLSPMLFIRFGYEGDDPNTVVIFVRYGSEMDRSVLNVLVNDRRKKAEIVIKHYGWSSWMKIKENVVMGQ